MNLQELSCPIPYNHGEQIVTGHGSGGRMSRELINNLFLKYFNAPGFEKGNDAAVIENHHVKDLEKYKVALSTDSHVVTPLFFSGGDIGRLAICGTVNDLAMVGAYPRFLTAGFILEEGLAISVLEKVVQSMKQAALEAGVEVIAGDTKVVENGKCDGLYINTAGLGYIDKEIEISGSNTLCGDVIIVSGNLGDHGIAVLEARGELGFTSGIKSDVAPLNHMVRKILNVSSAVHSMRDPTRGGLATALNEIAQQSNVCISIFEDKIPISRQANSACEMLGLDPLFIANEGKLVLSVAATDALKVLETIRSDPNGKDAAIIGTVTDEPGGKLLMQTTLGSRRMIDIPTGALLPRIC
jgi:hydrogenase expression/formation protein HypE